VAGLLTATWGFVVLNSVWAVVAIFKLWQLTRRRPAEAV
jgi:hypothetical protein